METMVKSLGLLVCGAALAAPGAALADEATPSAYSYSWHDSRMRSDIGVSAMLSGGIAGYTNETVRDAVATDVGALWGLRVTIGSHIPLGLDINYVGTAADIDALIGAQNGTLVGTTVEGAIRYNILPQFEWNPYVFGGIGWQRYDIQGGTFTLSDTGMNENDNSIVFPLGAGLAYRDPSGLVVDLHGTFRVNTRQGLVLETPGGTDYAPMHMWEASGAIGYEF